MGKRKSSLGKTPGLDFLTVIALIAAAIVSLFPVLWGLSTALKTDSAVTMFPPEIIPKEITWNNFIDVVTKSDFMLYMKNSLLITLISIVMATFVAAHAAYALTFFNIRFRKGISFFILMTSMVPPVALLVPLYMLSVKLNLYNTRILLVLIYTAWRTPILTWIMEGFFRKLPMEIVEAGIIDGCSKSKAFYKLILPISQPGIVSAALLSAVYVWNDYLVSSSFITASEKKMISVGLYQYITQYGIKWGLLMAAVMIYDFNYSDHYSVHLYAEKICGRNGGRSSQGIMRQEKEKRFMKAKTLKKGLGIALSMAMTMSLFGCGSGDSAKEQASDTSETTEVAENTDSKDSDTDKGGKDMTFWIFLDPKSTEDPRSVVLSNIVKEYNETNQYGNTVTVESFNYSVFESQAIQAAAAGKGPDIINCFSDQLKQHIDAGTVQPMTDYAKDFITEMGDYIYTSDKLTQSDGEIYSLPWESRVTAMWYRSDLYDSAPQSWDDLLAQSSKASTDTSLGFALGLSEDGNGTGLIETFIPWIRSAGGDFLDKDGKAVFNSDAGVKVVNFIKELVDNGSMDQTTMNMAYDDVVDAFKSGTVDAVNAGTQRAATIMTSNFADNFTSCPIPGEKEGESAPAYVAGQTLAIGKYAQNPEMAMDFIKFYLSEENQVQWVSANCLPVRTGVFDDESVKENVMYDSMQMWSEYAKTGEITFYPADYTELCTKLVKAVQNVVFQDADAKTELDEVAEWYNNK